jgi:hypothetical protein
MACQAASATASLREVLKAGHLCLQRIQDPKKISAMALNSTLPGHGTSFILYLGGDGDAKVLEQSPKPAGEDRSFGPEELHLIRISVHLLSLGIARGRVVFIGLVFYVLAPGCCCSSVGDPWAIGLSGTTSSISKGSSSSDVSWGASGCDSWGCGIFRGAS